MSGKWDEWERELREEWPPCPCRVCGYTIEVREYPYNQEFEICGGCARDLADIYHARHGGGWISGSPSQRAQRLAGRYVFLDKPLKPKKQKISKALALKVYERDGFKCVYCKGKKDLSCDHVTPEIKGGQTTINNLVTACRRCNSRKQTKSLADFWGAVQ